MDSVDSLKSFFKPMSTEPVEVEMTEGKNFRVSNFRSYLISSACAGKMLRSINA